MNILKGDYIKVINKDKIDIGFDLTNGKEYEVKAVFADGSIIVRDDANDPMLITIEEMKESIVKVGKEENKLSDFLQMMRELIGKAEKELGRKRDEKAERKHDEMPTMKIDLRNLSRKSIIQDAKDFVAKHTEYDCTVQGKSAVTYEKIFGVLPEFHVNNEKRTVTLLLKGAYDGSIMHREIVRCSPSDVFNEHIGKAIAVGRAFNKNIDKFINAAQPKEMAVGQKFKATSIGKVHGQRGEITKLEPNLDGLFGTAFYHTIDGGWLGSEQVRITDDTEAIYA